MSRDLQREVTFTKQMKDVIEWNATARGGVHDISEAALKLQWGLIEEEYNELLEAIKDNNVVEIYDALGDLFVVTVYYDYLYERLYNNLPETYIPICIGQNLMVFDIDFNSLVKELGNCIDEEDGAAVLDTWWVLQSTMAIDLGKVIDEIMRSNNSKFPAAGDLLQRHDSRIDAAIEKEEIHIYSNSRYEDIKGELVGDRVVFRADNGKGKIVKCSLFKEPDIEQFL